MKRTMAQRYPANWDVDITNLPIPKRFLPESFAGYETKDIDYNKRYYLKNKEKILKRVKENQKRKGL